MRKKVLFVCRTNSGRSQMAAGFYRMLTNEEPISAGTHVLEREGEGMPEFVIRSMAEVGYDITPHRRKQLTPKLASEADSIILMVNSPADVPSYLVGSPKVKYWDVPDARGQSYEFHQVNRDRIKSLVATLVSSNNN